MLGVGGAGGPCLLAVPAQRGVGGPIEGGQIDRPRGQGGAGLLPRAPVGEDLHCAFSSESPGIVTRSSRSPVSLREAVRSRHHCTVRNPPDDHAIAVWIWPRALPLAEVFGPAWDGPE